MGQVTAVVRIERGGNITLGLVVEGGKLEKHWTIGAKATVLTWWLELVFVQS